MKNNSYTVAVLGAGNIGLAVISRLLDLDNEVININLSKVLLQNLNQIVQNELELNLNLFC